jgi:hypothetical protein
VADAAVVTALLVVAEAWLVWLEATVGALGGVDAAATDSVVVVAAVGVAPTTASELVVGVETETTNAGAEAGAIVAVAGPPQAATSRLSPAIVVARNV